MHRVAGDVPAAIGPQVEGVGDRNFDGPVLSGVEGLNIAEVLDLSVDETMREVIDAVQRTGAKRLVIDSLAGFELALAPGMLAVAAVKATNVVVELPAPAGTGVQVSPPSVEREKRITLFPVPPL